MSMITGTDNILSFRIQTAIRGIALEINTGMKLTRGFSGVRFAKSYGYTGRTLKGALQYLVDGFGPEYEVPESVAKALAK